MDWIDQVSSPLLVCVASHGLLYICIRGMEKMDTHPGATVFPTAQLPSSQLELHSSAFTTLGTYTNPPRITPLVREKWNFLGTFHLLLDHAYESTNTNSMWTHQWHAGCLIITLFSLFIYSRVWFDFQVNVEIIKSIIIIYYALLHSSSVYQDMIRWFSAEYDGLQGRMFNI